MISIMSENLIGVLSADIGTVRAISGGTYLFHRGDEVRHLFLVETGEIHLIRHQTDGKSVVLQHARAGEMLAEASVFSREYHCDAFVPVNSSVLAIEKARFLNRFATDPEFALAWARTVSAKVQEARLRGEILSLRTVRDRLDAWLDWHGSLPPKGEWRLLAQSIGVSPEALYREIAHRRTRSKT